MVSAARSAENSLLAADSDSVRPNSAYATLYRLQFRILCRNVTRVTESPLSATSHGCQPVIPWISPVNISCPSTIYDREIAFTASPRQMVEHDVFHPGGLIELFDIRRRWQRHKPLRPGFGRIVQKYLSTISAANAVQLSSAPASYHLVISISPSRAVLFKSGPSVAVASPLSTERHASSSSRLFFSSRKTRRSADRPLRSSPGVIQRQPQRESTTTRRQRRRRSLSVREQRIVSQDGSNTNNDCVRFMRSSSHDRDSGLVIQRGWPGCAEQRRVLRIGGGPIFRSTHTGFQRDQRPW